jgi:hypothetical protein
MQLAYIVALLCVVFVLMYKPKKEKYTGPTKPPQAPVSAKEVAPQGGEEQGGQCCSNLDYMANNYRQCRNVHQEGIIFADPNYGCPEKVPETYLGAIIGN